MARELQNPDGEQSRARAAHEKESIENGFAQSVTVIGIGADGK